MPRFTPRAHPTAEPHVHAHVTAHHTPAHPTAEPDVYATRQAQERPRGGLAIDVRGAIASTSGRRRPTSGPQHSAVQPPPKKSLFLKKKVMYLVRNPSMDPAVDRIINQIVICMEKRYGNRSFGAPATGSIPAFADGMSIARVWARRYSK